MEAARSPERQRALVPLRCPECGGALTRVPRNPLDRLISLGVPLRRYRCRAIGCGWRGALRVG